MIQSLFASKNLSAEITPEGAMLIATFINLTVEYLAKYDELVIKKDL